MDRKALPEVEWTRPKLEDTFVAPRNGTEELLTGIWSTVLGLERVGIHDNFFELGGHPLLAIQVLSRLRNAVGIELPVRALFEGPTVADLARRINAIDQGIEAVAAFPSTSSTDREEFEL